MLYPLKFEGVYKDYIWGGRGLERFGKKLPEGRVAESWEISSHPDGESVVLNGNYKGILLTTLINKLGRDLMGHDLLEKDIKKFPLLIKLIDANDKLSVQVHPQDEYARINENGEYGKNEMWYIVSAKPGSQIVYGIKEGVTKESFAQAVRENRIEECLNYIDVKAGDAVIIPAGLVHAIGSGVLTVEIQQNSNTTYRVFDYDRIDKTGSKRTLHIDKALDVISFDNCGVKGKVKELSLKITKNSFKSYLVANEYFSVEKYNIDGKITEDADGSRFFTLTCLEGEGEIVYSSGREKIAKGESVLIPASMGKYHISGKLEVIKAYVPDIEKNIISPLIDAGYSREEIINSIVNG